MMLKTQDPWWLKIMPLSLRKLLVGRNNLHAVIHNIGWLFFDKVLRASLGIIVGAWIARYLGPSQFGNLSYCIAFIAIFQAIVNLGLDGIVVRDLASHKDSQNEILGTVFCMRILAGLVCWFFVVLGFGMMDGFSSNSLLIVMILGASLIFQASDTVDLWFQSQSQSRRTVITKSCAYLASNIFKVFLILMDAPLFAFAIAIALESALNALGLFIAYRRFPMNNRWKNQFQRWGFLLNESWPYILSSLAIIVYMRVDQIMVKNILDDSALGLYAAMLPISSIWNVIPMLVCISLGPYMARKKLEGKKYFNASLLLVFRLFLAMSVGISILIAIIAKPLLVFLYGSSFEAAGNILSIYVFTNVPIFLGLAQGIWILNYKKSHVMLFQTFIGAAVSVMGNLFLIPILGLQGAAITAVFSQLCSAVLVNIIFSKELFFMQLGIKRQ
ncbi:flippase [Polynucleobacter sp. KF022]|uniref:flippase n=1 Tax=Polynucleobacter sp. KF022 TaxID=2982615 RepID=UPI00237768D1|nr:flippase [Polynucleobacter sp. KF022]BDT74658.1 O-unit flippase [Polynucleobacter sp. KF022]